ncbi:MAG: S41 family peptidase [Pyrinomonadaceae bacterium]|nr:S41 family peptidase [Pyrinomonadaceae bacterium]
MNKGLLIVAIVLIGIGAVLGGFFGRSTHRTTASSALTTERISDNFAEALELIDKNYSDDVEREEILDSAVQTMLFSLDPHSSFFTKNELKKLFEEQSSRFFGIGVSILQHRDGVYVQSVVPNTPAEKQGMRYGDRIVKVDGKDATKWSAGEVSRNVRGPEGTNVNVQVERVGSEKPVSFDIKRGGVPYPSIRNSFMLDKRVGYVGLSAGFQETTSDELDAAIEQLKKQGMESLILDLRNNVGGLLPQAIEVTSRFVEKGKTVVSVKGRSNYTNAQELKAVGAPLHEFPLVVMINGGSASASEIVAGAIQDYGRGLVVGSESFGKGLVQKIYPLPYGTGLTLTTARYYTPYGRSLQRDYSNGSIYEYFSNGNGEENDQKPGGSLAKPKGKPVETAGGRVYYGGRGIEPDLKAPPLELTALRFRISEAAFFFVRKLAAGKVRGFESLRAEKQTYATVIGKNDVVVSNALFRKFISDSVADPENGLTAENIESQASYAKARLRAQLATAKYSGEAGFQVAMETDPQVLKAIDAIPDARILAKKVMAKNQ